MYKHLKVGNEIEFEEFPNSTVPNYLIVDRNLVQDVLNCDEPIRSIPINNLKRLIEEEKTLRQSYINNQKSLLSTLDDELSIHFEKFSQVHQEEMKEHYILLKTLSDRGRYKDGKYIFN